MDKHLLIAEAAPVMLAVVDRIPAGDSAGDSAGDAADAAPELGRPTPCAGWDVGQLCAHLLEWGPPLEGAARKERVAPGAGGGDLRAQVERLAAAWGEPAAWTGGTVMSTMELPADLVGGMVLGEFVLHGWDLARALDVPIAFSDDVLRALYAEVARSAEQGRAMGVYGPEVPVAGDAPLLDRVLGLSGRDPRWTSAVPA